MTAKKKQHYVPQLYLRFFSIDSNDSQIGLFHIPNDLFQKSVALKNQAKEDYFYGKDGFFEEQLSKIESLAAPSLKTVIESCSVPVKSSRDYLNLFAFTMFLASRTKDAAEDINSMADQMAKLLMKNHPGFKDQLDEYIIRHESAATLSIQATAQFLPITFDLRLKLLLNKSSQVFLTSDNPIIKFNQYLEQKKHPGGHLGLATKGLQIFFPISPVHMLCFYDDWAYKIGNRSSDIVELYEVTDVNKLNQLQILNAYHSIFFNEEISENYIRSQYGKLISRKAKQIYEINKHSSFLDEKGNTHEIHHYYSHPSCPS